MKQLSALLSLAVFLLAGLAGCQKNEVAPREPVTCTYQVLNSKGEETNVFTQGQEIFFRFSVTNHTDQLVYLKNAVFDYAHFMEVFAEHNGQLLPLGRPYDYLAQPYVGYFEVAPHKSFTYVCSWTESVPDPDLSTAYYAWGNHTPLPPGSYRTSLVPRVIWNHPYGSETSLPVATQDFVRRFEVR